MSVATTARDIRNDVGKKLHARIALLVGSAITLSGATIMTFQMALSKADLVPVFDGVEYAALTLLPYMISAVVAAITAVGVMALIPAMQLQQPANEVRDRLQALSEGDLSTKIHTREKAPHIQELVYEVNLATSALAHDIAQWKVINRQQWELLEAMREITVVSNQRQLVQIIEQMEKNWEKIAVIEDRLRT